MSKEGIIVIEWDCDVTNGDLAYMKFHMLSTKEDEYQWHILQDQIETIKDKIGTQDKELEDLKKALSLISSRSFYVPSSSTNSM